MENKLCSTFEKHRARLHLVSVLKKGNVQFDSTSEIEAASGQPRKRIPDMSRPAQRPGATQGYLNLLQRNELKSSSQSHSPHFRALDSHMRLVANYTTVPLPQKVLLNDVIKLLRRNNQVAP